jgi:SAM-dependent methyltransferase
VPTGIAAGKDDDVTEGATHPANDASYWDEAYRGNRDGWDMGTPTPVFVHLLDAWGPRIHHLVPGALADVGADSRLRVMVPCSGRGHDALLFAEHGYDVTAVDFADSAAQHLRDAAETHGLDLEVISDDLFSLARDRPAAYDMLLEYTCLCAIDPVRREEYVNMCASVLRPGGLFFGLIFPVDGRPGGPPWNIDTAELAAMMDRFFTLKYDEVPDTSVKPRLGRERLMVWERRP